MFWRKKIQPVQKLSRTVLEEAILQYLISNLQPEDAKVLERQLAFRVYIRRLNYKTQIATEFYGPKNERLPDSELLKKKDDFCLARIKLSIDSHCIAEVFCVLGYLFELRVSPIVLGIDKIEAEQIRFLRCTLDKDFETKPDS